MILVSNISSNVAEVRGRIAAAARKAGRDPGEIALIAVTKNRSVDEIRAAVAAGVTDLGENRVQEAVHKWRALGPIATWHMIGTLQSNKAAQATEFADLIHSLDRPSLARELSRLAAQRQCPIRALIQVNVAGEATKHGVSPAALEPLLETVVTLGGIRVEGLMTIAPLAADQATVQPVFARLRQWAERIGAQKLSNVEMRWLSMGMSGDYEAAIAEGANMVRIGTAIFGERPAPAGA